MPVVTLSNEQYLAFGLAGAHLSIIGLSAFIPGFRPSLLHRIALVTPVFGYIAVAWRMHR